MKWMIAFLICIPTLVSAQKKTACNAPWLNMTEGATWNYIPVTSPLQQKFMDDPMLRSKGVVIPPVFTKVFVKVDSIVNKDNKTTINLTETIDDVELKTQIVCSSSGITVSPQSLFFTAEAAGGSMLTLSINKHSGSTYQTKGSSLGKSWSETIKASFTQSHKGKPGNLTIQRDVKAVPGGAVVTLEKTYKQTIKVVVKVTGSVKLEGQKEEFGVAENTINSLWFANGVGLVQFSNAYGHMFQLHQSK